MVAYICSSRTQIALGFGLVFIKVTSFRLEPLQLSLPSTSKGGGSYLKRFKIFKIRASPNVKVPFQLQPSKLGNILPTRLGRCTEHAFLRCFWRIISGQELQLLSGLSWNRRVWSGKFKAVVFLVANRCVFFGTRWIKVVMSE